MVRSTFFGFEASKSALFSNQKSLDIVGNNLANANTDGYTRQRVETTATTYSASINRIAVNSVGQAGAGVTTLGVSQVRDMFIDKNYRDELSDASYYSKQKDILTEVQSSLPDSDVTSSAGLTGALESINSSLNGYIQNPTYESEANIVKSSFASMVQVLHDASNSLDEVESREKADLGTTVDRVNTILTDIQNYNKAISTEKNSLSTTDSAYFSPNELMDKQNLLLDELSKYTTIGVSKNADNTLNVSFVNASGAQTTVVNGKDTASTPLRLTLDSDNMSFALSSVGKDATTGAEVLTTDDANKNYQFKAGTMKAYVDVLTGTGANSGTTNTTQGIPYYRTMLNAFAQQLVTITNNTVPDTTDSNGTIKTETKADGTTGTVFKGLLGAKADDGTISTTGTVTAANIAISSDWSKDSGYFIFNKNDNVEDYAQLLASRLSGSAETTFSYGAKTATDAAGNAAYSETFTGNFENYVINLTGKIGTDVSSATNSYTATNSVANDFLTQRESNSGVQRDEETANMLEYQKAYQASARMMTIMDDLLDTLINDLGAKIS